MGNSKTTQPIFCIKPFHSLADPRSGYYTTTEDFETACDTDDESSNAIAAGLPKPLRKKKAARQ